MAEEYLLTVKTTALVSASSTCNSVACYTSLWPYSPKPMALLCCFKEIATYHVTVLLISLFDNVYQDR